LIVDLNSFIKDEKLFAILRKREMAKQEQDDENINENI